jgi:hypothetical protein
MLAGKVGLPRHERTDDGKPTVNVADGPQILATS